MFDLIDAAKAEMEDAGALLASLSSGRMMGERQRLLTALAASTARLHRLAEAACVVGEVEIAGVDRSFAAHRRDITGTGADAAKAGETVWPTARTESILQNLEELVASIRGGRLPTRAPADPAPEGR
ncbi:MAG: hypothetical protein AB7R90_19315 [Reyranellaceae bacterium]